MIHTMPISRLTWGWPHTIGQRYGFLRDRLLMLGTSYPLDEIDHLLVFSKEWLQRSDKLKKMI